MFLSNTYHSFAIRMVILSELLIFLSVFVLSLYYSSNNYPELSFIAYLDSFKIDLVLNEVYTLCLVAVLCIILLSIKSFFYLLKSLYVYIGSSLVYKDFLICMIILSLFFICIQYYEFICSSICYLDGVNSLCAFTLLSIHCLHVFIGFVLLLFLCFTFNFSITFLDDANF